jgi:hypothetical protein
MKFQIGKIYCQERQNDWAYWQCTARTENQVSFKLVSVENGNVTSVKNEVEERKIAVVNNCEVAQLYVYYLYASEVLQVVNKRGGKRPGAGRKKKGAEVRIHTALKLEPTLVENAKKSLPEGFTVSDLVNQLLRDYLG